MRTFINGVILGLLLGVGGYWIFSQSGQRAAVQEAQKRVQESVAQGAAQVEKVLAAKLEALDLQAGPIMEELAQSGKVVRRKARDVGAVIADAALEAQTTAAIKARIATDPQLSVLQISVDTTAGVATLSGTVSSPELVGRAMLLALETKGVTQVVSTLQIK